MSGICDPSRVVIMDMGIILFYRSVIRFADQEESSQTRLQEMQGMIFCLQICDPLRGSRRIVAYQITGHAGNDILSTNM